MKHCYIYKDYTDCPNSVSCNKLCIFYLETNAKECGEALKALIDKIKEDKED